MTIDFLALTSAALFYLTPIIIGRAFIILKKLAYNSNAKLNFNKDDDVAFAATEIVMSFVYGALIIYGFAFLVFSEKLEFISRTNFANDLRKVLILTLIISLGIITIQAIYSTLKKPDISINKLLVPLIILLMSFISYGIWRWDSPLNTTLNWDLYEHQTISNIMEQGRFDVTPLKLSDTFQFNSYSTMFHVLIFQSQQLVKSDVLAYWWYVEYFHLLGTIAVSYVIGYAMTKNKWIGLISALFGSMIFESFVAYTSLFLIPQNIAATVIVAFIARSILRFKNGDQSPEISTGIVIIYLLLNHLIIGLAGVAIIAFTNMYIRLFDRLKSVPLQQILMFLAMLAVVVSPAITSHIDLNSINRGEAAHFNLNIGQKVDLARDFYGFTLFIFFPLGLIYVVNRKNTDLYLLVMITLITLSVVVATLPYTLKFYTIGRYLVHALMAVGFWDVIKLTNKKLKALSITLLLLGLTVIYSLNVNEFKQTPTYLNKSTHITPYEIAAAEFIKTNYANQDVWVFSEPATMYMLEGLSGVNSPGGVFTVVENRIILNDIFFTRDSVEMPKMIFDTKDLLIDEKPDKILLAISGRFSHWQEAQDQYKFEIFWNVWTPQDLALQDHDFMSFLTEYAEFEQVFKNPGIAIYEVDNPYKDIK